MSRRGSRDGPGVGGLNAFCDFFLCKIVHVQIIKELSFGWKQQRYSHDLVESTLFFPPEIRNFNTWKKMLKTVSLQCYSFSF